MKRRWIALLLVALLALLPASAVADADVRSVKARDIQVSRLTDVLIIREENSDYYKLITADGQDLTGAVYSNIRSASNYPFFQVSARSSADGVHDEGLLDLQGNVVIPTEYADIMIFSDRWQAGVKLVPSEADDKDYTFTNYSTNEKSFYRIDTVDFYFDGNLAGSLGRSEFGENYCTAHGAYICVIDRTRQYTYYNSHMEPSPRASSYSAEFESEYKNGKTTYYHQGSGQVAYVESCTLTPDEVDNPYLYDRGIVYGLQGQEIFKPAQNYDYIREFNGGYATASMNRYYGLIDEQGNEVVPVIYDELSYNFNPKYGYIGAAKDGKFGFVDLNGNVTCDFTYSKEIVNDRGTFATITNLDGTTIVLSAAVGELPEHYADTSFPGYNGCLAFVATNTAGQKGVVDIYGNVQIPFSDDNSYIDLNSDATVAVVNQGSRNYQIYRLNIQSPVAAGQSANESANASTADNGSADNAAASTGDDGSWTCENGHSGNTGNFCSECGAAKPVKASCPSCGFEFEGDAPKFCPNCGAQQ